jgi:uncharacterized protein YwqG
MNAKSVKMPSAPTNHRLQQVIQWCRQPEYSAARLESYLAWTLLLPEIPSESRRVEDLRSEFPDSELGFLGGPSLLASVEDWPRNADGKPMAHIMTLSLGAISHGSATDQVFHSFPSAKSWLPKTGTFELFHDRETYGWSSDDKAADGWHIRYKDVAQQELELCYGPDDLDLDLEEGYGQLFHSESTIMLPSSLDIDDSEPSAFEAAESALHQYLNMWEVYSLGEPSQSPSAFTHLYGRSLAGEVAIRPTIAEVLPVDSENDEHILLMEISTSGALTGWFGDIHPVEVWMRSSDLQRLAFEHAWCVIRSDC